MQNIHDFVYCLHVRLRLRQQAGRSGRCKKRPPVNMHLLKEENGTYEKACSSMALAMALGLAACSGSALQPRSAASSGAVSAPAASGTSASEADDGIAMTGGNVEEHSVEAIKAKGVLVVTTEATRAV